MKTIVLTRGYETVVDDDVYEWASKYNWCVSGPDGSCYAARTGTEEDGIRKGKTIFLHKEILKLRDYEQGDHKDRDKFNNTLTNLRKCTCTQNNCNKIGKPRKSKFRGVRWNRNAFQVEVSGEYVGRFTDELEAAKVYDITALQRHGEFVVLNFPQNIESYKEEISKKTYLMIKCINELNTLQKRIK